MARIFPGRVAPLLEKKILRKADNDKKRGDYAETAGLVRIYASCVGRETANSLVDRLVEKHPRQPAMQEELEKARKAGR